MPANCFVQSSTDEKFLELWMSEDLRAVFELISERRDMTVEGYLSYFIERYGNYLLERIIEEEALNE